MTAQQRRDRPDRDEVIARTDLAALADELLGGHVGQGRSAKWPSPVPGHPHTGKSPPMSIFISRRGEQRWTCFATGEGGTAIDLVMLRSGRSVGEAISWLADRASAANVRCPAVSRAPTLGAAARGETPSCRPKPRVEAYVATCEKRLWLPEGRSARRWLVDERGFAEEVLRANRIGFDPGPAGFARPGGLPKLGEAVVMPTLDERDRSIYFQARYLEPTAVGRKYDNPSSWVAQNPRLAEVRTPDLAEDRSNYLIVTEGIPDALAAATNGYAVRAVLGAQNATRETALRLVDEPRVLVLAFDGDHAGREASCRITADLVSGGRRARLERWTPPAEGLDLNDWLQARRRTARGTPQPIEATQII